MVIIILFIYGIIILLNIVVQFSKPLFNLMKYNFFGVVMIWKLFAPSPREVDVKMFYRDLFDNGKTSKLKEIFYYKKPALKYFFWKTTDINYSTIAKYLKLISIMKSKKNYTDEEVFKSREYKAVELIVKRQPRYKRTIKRQLVLLKSYGYHTELEPEVLMIAHVSYKKNF